MNTSLLKKMVEKGYVSKKKHPSENLYIYNYTAKTQYKQFWNETTLQTRGLILDSDYNIISRPFKKFFNYEELKNIPSGNFEVFNKLDGSLGISYPVGDTTYIATRGSFISEQAKRANYILRTKYSSVKFKKGRTYLFEIIYPENKIIVDYGNTSDLFLLAVIDNKTGKDLPLEEIGFPIVERFDGFSDFKKLKALNLKNQEGFVVRFDDGFRFKIKFNDYVRLHKILTEISNKTIWEYLREGRDFKELLEKVPDEFYNWVKRTKQDLETQHREIIDKYLLYFKSFNVKDRKEFALYAKNYQYPFLLFSLLDGRDVSDMVWKIIKPKHQKPFKEEI
ncbi:MAG: hypothetical protein J7L15_01500 [Clostridiales bacterium]|nr:hypothetical protein [Clostridiales bacterium]